MENGVLVAERWILARLRNRRFFSLAELKLAISEELEILNNKPFQVLEGCRRSMYEKLDRPALQPLPAERFVYREYAKPRVNIDYHVMLDDNYYSVPHQLLHQKLDAYLTKNTVEIFHKGQRVASHKRFVGVKGQYATDPLHMPAAHRKYREWPPSRLISWGENIGPNTGELIKALLESKPHPELGYRSCLGIFRLSGQYGAQRLEAAAQRALACKAITYKSIKSILENGLDQIPYQAPEDSQIVPIHKNVRGSLYYSGKGATTCS